MMGRVYLIHFDRPIGNPGKAHGQAQHYRASRARTATAAWYCRESERRARQLHRQLQAMEPAY